MRPSLNFEFDNQAYEFQGTYITADTVSGFLATDNGVIFPVILVTQ